MLNLWLIPGTYWRPRNATTHCCCWLGIPFFSVIMCSFVWIVGVGAPFVHKSAHIIISMRSPTKRIEREREWDAKVCILCLLSSHFLFLFFSRRRDDIPLLAHSGEGKKEETELCFENIRQTALTASFFRNLDRFFRALGGQEKNLSCLCVVQSRLYRGPKKHIFDRERVFKLWRQNWGKIGQTPYRPPKCRIKMQLNPNN